MWLRGKTRDSCWVLITQTEHVIIEAKMKWLNQQISTGFFLFLIASETSEISHTSDCGLKVHHSPRQIQGSASPSREFSQPTRADFW